MSQQNPQGQINIENDFSGRKDYLYRISIKALIRNDIGNVLVVKETGRDWWDLPGGGMDHGEDIRSALARELVEEINLTGSFAYKIIAVEEPAHLTTRDIYQIRLVFEVKPENLNVSNGEDGDEIKFINPASLEHSDIKRERQVFEYSKIS